LLTRACHHPISRSRDPLITMILAIVDDLFFLSKIRETAKHLGVAVELAQPANLTSSPAGEVSAFIIDLNLRSGNALEVVRSLKSDVRTKGIPAIGFISHVQSDLIAGARQAGCDLILARSAFVRELPDLLQRYSVRQNQTDH